MQNHFQPGGALSHHHIGFKTSLLAKVQELRQPERFRPEVITTALEFCQSGLKVARNVVAGYTPYLLLDDEINPGFFAKLPIFDTPPDFLDSATGSCWVELNSGPLLIPQDTAVYWA